jgi:hypothetical protein
MRETTPEEKAECKRQRQLLQANVIKSSCWFTVFSDGDAMTVGREDAISIVGTEQLLEYMEII